MRKIEHKATFNEAAELYAEARPGYPDAIIEVGSVTGQATLPRDATHSHSPGC